MWLRHPCPAVHFLNAEVGYMDCDNTCSYDVATGTDQQTSFDIEGLDIS